MVRWGARDHIRHDSNTTAVVHERKERESTSVKMSVCVLNYEAEISDSWLFLYELASGFESLPFTLTPSASVRECKCMSSLNTLTSCDRRRPLFKGRDRKKQVCCLQRFFFSCFRPSQISDRVNLLWEKHARVQQEGWCRSTWMVLGLYFTRPKTLPLCCNWLWLFSLRASESLDNWWQLGRKRNKN